LIGIRDLAEGYRCHEPPKACPWCLSGQRTRFQKVLIELLKWIHDFNPGFHTEHWRVLDRLPELKGQRLTLIIELNSYEVIN
jgi:hypothetical protein